MIAYSNTLRTSRLGRLRLRHRSADARPRAADRAGRQPVTLADSLNTLIFSGMMSADLRNIIVEAVESLPADELEQPGPARRVPGGDLRRVRGAEISETPHGQRRPPPPVPAPGRVLRGRHERPRVDHHGPLRGQRRGAVRERLQGAGLRLPVRRQRLEQHARAALRRRLRRLRRPARRAGAARCADPADHAAGGRRHRLRAPPEHDRPAGALPAGTRRLRAQRRHADRAGDARAVPPGRHGDPAAALLAQRPDAAVADLLHRAQRPGDGLGRAHRRSADVAERHVGGVAVDRPERLEHLPGRTRRLPAADRPVGHRLARGLRRRASDGSGDAGAEPDDPQAALERLRAGLRRHRQARAGQRRLRPRRAREPAAAPDAVPGHVARLAAQDGGADDPGAGPARAAAPDLSAASAATTRTTNSSSTTPTCSPS